MTHSEATVNWHDSARDVGGVRARKKRNRTGDFGSLGHAAKRDGGSDVCELIVGERSSHVGFDRAGSDDVDGDRSRTEFASERANPTRPAFDAE